MKHLLYLFINIILFTLFSLFFGNCSRQSFDEFTKSDGFQKFCGCPVKKKPHELTLGGTEADALGKLEAGSLDSFGADFYLHRMYEGLKKSYEHSGVKFTETPTGVKAPGFEIRRVEEPNEKGVPQLKALVFTLEGDVSFTGNSTTLNPKAKPILERLGNGFVAYPETEIQIYNHADSPGDYNKNLQLTKERAKVIKSELQNGRSIPESSFKQVEGLADDKKIVDTKKAEPKNRRTEIIIETIK